MGGSETRSAMHFERLTPNRPREFRFFWLDELRLSRMRVETDFVQSPSVKLLPLAAR